MAAASTRKLKRPKRGGANAEINTSETRSVKDLIAFFEGLGRARAIKFEKIIRKLKKKNYSTGEIIDFIKKNEKNRDIEKLADDLPEKKAANNSGSNKGTNNSYNSDNNSTYVPSHSGSNSDYNSSGSNNSGSNKAANNSGTNNSYNSENNSTYVPSHSGSNSDYNSSGSNNSGSNAETNANSLTEYQPLDEWTKKQFSKFIAILGEPTVQKYRRIIVKLKNKAYSDEDIVKFINDNKGSSNIDKKAENMPALEDDDSNTNNSTYQPSHDGNSELSDSTAPEQADETTGLNSGDLTSLYGSNNGLSDNSTAPESQAPVEVETTGLNSGDLTSLYGSNNGLSDNTAPEQAQAEGKDPCEEKLNAAQAAYAALVASLEESVRTAEAAKAAAEEAAKAAETTTQEVIDATKKSLEATAKAAADAIESHELAKKQQVSIETQTNNTGLNNSNSLTFISNSSNIQKNRSETLTDDRVDATFLPYSFAQQTNTIGSNFLSLFGIYSIESPTKKTIVYNPVGFLKRLPTFTLKTPVEGALYILLDQFAVQFKAVMADEEKTDDQKIINIIALREMVIRTLIHVCAYYAWLADQDSANMSPITLNELKKTERITVDEVKEYFFKADDTYTILEKYIWSVFKPDTIEAMASTMSADHKSIIVVEIIEHHSYSCTLEEFLEQQRFIVDADVSGDLYKIYSSVRSEEVLRFYKDLIQKDITSEKELTITDMLYAASISPVRFTRLTELADFINKENGYDEEVEEEEEDEADLAATPEEEELVVGDDAIKDLVEAEAPVRNVAGEAYKRIAEAKAAKEAAAAAKAQAEKKAKEEAPRNIAGEAYKRIVEAKLEKAREQARKNVADRAYKRIAELKAKALK